MSDTHWDSEDLVQAAGTTDQITIGLVQKHFGQRKTKFTQALFNFLLMNANDTLTNQHFSDLKKAWDR